MASPCAGLGRRLASRPTGFTLVEMLVALGILAGVLAVALRLLIDLADTLQAEVQRQSFAAMSATLVQRLELDLEQAGAERDGAPWLLLGEGALLRLRTWDEASGTVQAVAYWQDATGGLHRAAVALRNPTDVAAPALEAPIEAYMRGLPPEETRLVSGLRRVTLRALLPAAPRAPEVLWLELESASGPRRAALLSVGFRACHRPYPLTPYGPCN